MRINFYGGPSAGKSTTAAFLFSELKRRGHSVELVTEYVKSWATQNRKVNEFDQVYLFGKQMQYEYRYLQSGVRNIVTDSPILLSAIYAKHYYSQLDFHDSLFDIAAKYEKRFPSINIYLERGTKPYSTQGRYQSYKEALDIDDKIKDFLLSSDIVDAKTLFILNYSEPEIILNTVLQHLSN